MKSMQVLVVSLFLMFAGLACAERRGIEPMLGEQFGVAMVVDLEFVEKPNAYFAQNIIEEK